MTIRATRLRGAGLALAVAVQGMTAGAARAEDFDKLLVEAIASHPSVQGRRAGQDAARFDREGAEWQQFPTPSFEMASRTSAVAGTGRNTSLLALEQPLWAGGRISAGIRAAGFREAAATAAIVEAKQTVGLRVIGAYTEVQRNQQRHDHARAAVAEHERLFDLIDRRVRQEVSAPSDRDFAQARSAQAKIDASQSEQAVQTSRVQLGQLVGRQVGSLDPIRLDGRQLPASLDQAFARALERSPVMARLEQEQLAASEDVDVRRGALMPQLALRFEKQFGDLADSRALLVLRAQPGAGLSAGSAVAAARRRADEARIAKDEAQRAIREQVQTAFTEWRAALSRLDDVRLSASMTQSVFDSYGRQYVAGRKTWIDVLNAMREISQAQYTLADAEALVRAAALRLWLLTGEAPLAEAAAK